MLGNTPLFDEFEQQTKLHTVNLFNFTKRDRENKRSENIRNLENFGIVTNTAKRRVFGIDY